MTVSKPAVPAAPSPRPAFRRHPALGAVLSLAILVAAGALLRGTAASSYWLFDDPQILRFVEAQSAWQAFFRPEVWQRLEAPFFTPLLTASYAADLHAFGLAPAAFHAHQAISLVLAAAATALFLRRWVSLPWATAAALLFIAGFPSGVVASQVMTRHYVEGLVLALAAWHFFIASASGARARLRAWAGGACYLLAMLAKEVYIPLIVILAVTALAARPAPLQAWRTVAARLLPFAIALGVYLPWRWAMLSGAGGYTARLVPTGEQLLAFLTLAPAWLLGSGVVGVVAGALVIGLLAFGLRLRVYGAVAIVVALAALLLPLLPVIASAPMEAAAAYFIPHRYLFVPWWALACAIVVVLARLPVKPATVAAPLLFLACLLLTGPAAQTERGACLDQLMADNERSYRAAWSDGPIRRVAAPPELVPYLQKMFGYIAEIRGVDRSRLPQVQALDAATAPDAQTLVWTYRSCRRTRAA